MGAIMERKCKKDKECWEENEDMMRKCLKNAKNPCMQKAAKSCKNDDEPKACFWKKAKACKKDEEEEDEELEELKKVKDYKQCAKKIAMGCEKRYGKTEKA